jgi:hypothetical protein
MTDFNFKIDPIDYKGIEHEEFTTNLLNLALTRPTEYNKLRMHVLKKVKKAAVESQYSIYYYLLTDGCSVAPDGKTKSNHILYDANDGSENHHNSFKPRVPKHIVNH